MVEPVRHTDMHNLQMIDDINFGRSDVKAPKRVRRTLAATGDKTQFQRLNLASLTPLGQVLKSKKGNGYATHFNTSMLSQYADDSVTK